MSELFEVFFFSAPLRGPLYVGGGGEGSRVKWSQDHYFFYFCTLPQSWLGVNTSGKEFDILASFICDTFIIHYQCGRRCICSAKRIFWALHMQRP